MIGMNAPIPVVDAGFVSRWARNGLNVRTLSLTQSAESSFNGR